MKVCLLLFVFVTAIATFALAEEMKPMDQAVTDPAKIQWGPCPPNLPPGCKTVVLQGDPSKAGELFTMRAWWPNGYKIMPHSHPQQENLTVISGAFHVGMGDKFDATKGEKLSAGGFRAMPKEMNHYAWAEGDTVVQVNALGPFAIKYANPADDPSIKK